MNISELIMQVKNVSFKDIVWQSDVATKEDIDRLVRDGYCVSLTATEFAEKFPGIDPAKICFTNGIANDCYYYNRETLAITPFHYQAILLGMRNITVQKAIELFGKIEAKAAKGDFFQSAWSLPDGMRLEYFTMLMEKRFGEIQNFYELFITVYSESDYGFTGLSLDTLLKIMSARTDADLQKREEKLADLPETVKIYRGENTRSLAYDKAFSWTYDRNIAYLFACRFGNGPGRIVEAEISKNDVFDVIDSKDESEVLINPADIKNVKVTELHGLSYLERTLPPIIGSYQKYRNMMDDIDFEMDSEEHDRLHQARALLLTQIIAREIGMTKYEADVLAIAAIYHDTRRDNDGEDSRHGRYAAEYYAEDVAVPNKLVQFLCEYHCRPDEDGYEAIKKDKWLKKRKEQATKLIQVFKDSDGLDRVRFGIRAIDVNQLRLDISKQLVLVARICLDQIKV